MRSVRGIMGPTVKDSSGKLKWIIIAATLSRLVLNTGRRFAYPFAPALSRGLGVDLTAITSIIAVSQSSGFGRCVFRPCRRPVRLSQHDDGGVDHDFFWQ